MNENKKYLRPEEASKILKVTVRTLENWESSGKIRCIRTKGGHRRFLWEDIVSKVEGGDTSKIDSFKESFIYCRVSTASQKEDLERQVDLLRSKYPDFKIIKDIGSGINFKRKGFNTILDSAIKGNLKTLVVTHRDRLCRFGFEFFERIIREYSNGEIVVLNSEKTSPEKELVDDLISIITVFSSRIYGLRAHSIKKKIKEAAETKDSKDIENQAISN